MNQNGIIDLLFDLLSITHIIRVKVLDEKKTVLDVGGSIEKAVKGDFTINQQSILKEAWQNTLSSRMSINLGLLVIFIFATIISLLVIDALGGYEVILEDPQASMIFNVIVTLLTWPFLAGIEMMGVLHSVGMKTQPKLVFSFLKRGSWVALCALISSLFVGVGLQLFVIPGIFLAVALSLVIPLVVEKKFSPIKAIIVSLQALRFQWFKIFSLYLILISLLIVSLFPLIFLAQTSFSVIGGIIFFFSLSYLAPFYYNIKGILYREIFGLQLISIDGVTLPPTSNDTFSA